MEIDLGNEVVITVKINGESYKLREPRMDDVAKITDSENTDPSKVGAAFTDFVVGLGLPEEIANSLGIIRTRKLAEGLTGTLAEKK